MPSIARIDMLIWASYIAQERSISPADKQKLRRRRLCHFTRRKNVPADARDSFEISEKFVLWLSVVLGGYRKCTSCRYLIIVGTKCGPPKNAWNILTIKALKKAFDVGI